MFPTILVAAILLTLSVADRAPDGPGLPKNVQPSCMTNYMSPLVDDVRDAIELLADKDTVSNTDHKVRPNCDVMIKYKTTSLVMCGATYQASGAQVASMLNDTLGVCSIKANLNETTKGRVETIVPLNPDGSTYGCISQAIQGVDEGAISGPHQDGQPKMVQVTDLSGKTWRGGSQGKKQQMKEPASKVKSPPPS